MNRVSLYVFLWFLLSATGASAQEPLSLPNYVPPGLELEEEGALAESSADTVEVASRDREEKYTPWMMPWNVSVDFDLDELPFFQKSGADEDVW